MNKPFSHLLPEVAKSHAEIRTAPSLERRRLRAYIAMLVIDLGLIMLGFALAGFAYTGRWWEARAMMQAQLLLPMYYTIAFYNAAYSTRALEQWRFGVRQALVALVIGAVLLNFVAFYLKTNANFSRVTFTLGLALSGVMIIAARKALALFLKRFWGGKVRNELIIDDGGPSFWLPGAQTISTREAGLSSERHDPFMRDRLGKVMRNQDKVVVSCPYEKREDWAFLLKSTGIHGELVSEPAHRLGALGVMLYDEQDRTTLVVSTGPLGMRARIMKRCFDLAVAGGALLVLAPLLAVIALLIKLEDGGKVLFVQRRLGRGNTFFNMLKFRTMREAALDHDGKASTAREDDRVTRIGRWLRSTSLDELPQLVNVLRGEMSIVGPRPHALGSRANNKLFWEVDGRYWKRHALKPGLTGLAQVRGHRGSTEEEKDLTDRLQADLEYLNHWSLPRDVGIVLQTLRVLTHKNAY
ncbi:sugar transferase [Altererythrobacter sp. GH1-8]|uniref:sugar transferase n=1 Tax=Altererythrobacter sp. GH1-8 TaxID=3349333 RepID=UPI00374DDE95